jgi:hypothetical protein
VADAIAPEEPLELEEDSRGVEHDAEAEPTAILPVVEPVDPAEPVEPAERADEDEDADGAR